MGGKTVTRKCAPASRSTRSGITSQSKRSARKPRAELVIAGRPKNGTGIPSFIFWSASSPRCTPRFSAAIARRAATAPFGMNSAIAAQPPKQAVDQRIVGGAIDLGDRDPVLDAGKRADLPIGDMAGENDHPPSGGDRTLDVLEAVRLNAPARLKDAEFLEMRVFGRDASEVVPHAGDDARDLGLG